MPNLADYLCQICKCKSHQGFLPKSVCLWLSLPVSNVLGSLLLAVPPSPGSKTHTSLFLGSHLPSKHVVDIEVALYCVYCFDCMQTLSTASPGVGGIPPQVPTKRFVYGYEPRMEDVRNIMHRNIDQLMNRGEQLEKLSEKCESMSRDFSHRMKTRQSDAVKTRVTSPTPSAASGGVGASSTFLIDRIATIDRFGSTSF